MHRLTPSKAGLCAALDRRVWTIRTNDFAILLLQNPLELIFQAFESFTQPLLTLSEGAVRDRASCDLRFDLGLPRLWRYRDRRPVLAASGVWGLPQCSAESRGVVRTNTMQGRATVCSASAIG